MALTSYLMKELIQRVKPGMSIASMGYPDIIITPDEVSEIVGNVGLKYLDRKVSKRHSVDYLIPDAQDFFKSLDIGLDVYDVVKERGCEIALDLNNIYSNYYAFKEYDVVIDVGTLEHCFNIGQALMNMAKFVKKGGFIIHENPYNCGNHGFYNLNPTLFHDFYEENGFELVSMNLVSRTGISNPAPETSRFYANGECNLITVAKRIKVQDFRYPIQTKYKKLLGE